MWHAVSMKREDFLPIIFFRNIAWTRTFQMKLKTDYSVNTKEFMVNIPGSISGHVIPKALKMVLDTYLLNTQHYKVFGLGVRVFANCSGDLGSIPGRVIPKTQKMVLDASLLNTQHYKVRIKGKVEQSREGVAPSPTPWCSSYRKGNLRVTLDYGRQLYLLIKGKVEQSRERNSALPSTSV